MDLAYSNAEVLFTEFLLQNFFPPASDPLSYGLCYPKNQILTLLFTIFILKLSSVSFCQLVFVYF